MKTRLIIICIAFLLFKPIIVVPTQLYFNAPELFGSGAASMISVYPPIGSISSPMGEFVIVSWREYNGYDCIIFQLISGHPMVKDYSEFGEAPYYKPVSCHLVPIKDKMRFSGWIFFRTHKRPFCASEHPDKMPRCRSY